MLRRLWCFWVGLFAGGVVAVLYLHHQPETETTNVSDAGVLERDLSAPTRAAGAAEFTSSGAENVMTTSAGEVARESEGAHVPDTSLPPPPPLNPVAIGEREERRFEPLLREEPIDHHWAPRMESRILQDVDKADLPIVAVQVHCRTTICRLEVVVDLAQIPPGSEPFYRTLMDAVSVVAREGGWRVNTVSGRVVGERRATNLPGLTTEGVKQTLIAHFHKLELRTDPVELTRAEWEEVIRRRPPEQQEEVRQVMERALSRSP